MAKIKLENIKHSYSEKTSERIWALKNINLELTDGGAYALLGPSGCGKTTLLNIISGLINPTEGIIKFDNNDVSKKTTIERDIAQIFQFPVIYDTMTVYENLAFPLKNKNFDNEFIKKQVHKISEILDLTSILDKRASNLTADQKQKISLGRGLVRPKVNALLFDEPLTVIDPHLKWLLKSKLKELHQQFNTTMIYVTHDQTEALTFADKVVVMQDGDIVQLGTPVDLFEKPNHLFVGHFIGSPGINILPCQIKNNSAFFLDFEIKKNLNSKFNNLNNLKIGIRPEFIKFDTEGLPVEIATVKNIGKNKIVDVVYKNLNIKLVLSDHENVPEKKGKIKFNEKFTYLYSNEYLIN